MICNVLRLSLISTCLSAAFPAAALAQDAGGRSTEAPESEIEGVGDIIVTAQRRSERLQEVPISVIAVSADALADRGITALNAIELPQFTPGLVAPQINSRPSYFLRGIGSNAGNANNEPSVALYIDGVFSPNPMSNSFDFNNIERVEVLKGPQGTLFGRNATGGVIQVITRDPSLTAPAMKADIGYSSFETVTANLYSSVPLSPELAVDVAAHYEVQEEGYGRNLATGMDVRDGYSLGVRSKILWQPSDRTTIRLSGIYSERSHAGYPSANAVTSIATLPSVYDLNSNLQPLTRAEYHNVTLKLEQDLDFANLVSISAYQYAIQRQRQDLDFTPADAAGLDFFQHTRTYSEELQLLSPTGAKFDWTLGLYLYDSESVGNPSILYTPAANSAITAFTPTKSVSVYGQATYEIVPGLKVTGGLRWTGERQRVFGSILNRLTNAITTPPEQRQSFSKLTWRGALDYAFNDDVHAYASFNRGIKSGGFVLVNLTAAGYAPEILDAYEIGIKSQFLNDRVRFNAAAFYYDYRNVQVTSTVEQNNTVITIINNAAEARLKGIDVDFEVRPSRRFSLTGGFVILDANYTNYRNAVAFNASRTATGPFVVGQIYNGRPVGAIPGGAFAIDASGNRLPYSADFSGNLAATYNLPTAVGDWRISGNLSYTSSYVVDPDNRIVVPSRTIVNAALGWTSNSRTLGIDLWVKNLTDLRYLTYIDEGAVGDNAAYAPPRTYGVTARVTF